MIELRRYNDEEESGSVSESRDDDSKEEDFKEGAEQPLLNLEEPEVKVERVKWSTRLLKWLGFIKPIPDRTIHLNGHTDPPLFPNNKIRNQKYHIATFVPMVLINQFKFFFNLFFLVIAITQFFPFLRVGFLFTYIAPLAFVLLVTMLNEAWDDFLRYLRDKDINEKVYAKLTENGELVDILSENIKVGDIIKVKQNERIPADMVLLYTTEHENANVFIRTDQLDGETDWKLRKSVGYTAILFT